MNQEEALTEHQDHTFSKMLQSVVDPINIHPEVTPE